jgi:serine phosphatase RsbU (regulator of sigma subunit)
MHEYNTAIQQQNERIRYGLFKLLCLGLGVGALAWTVICIHFELYRSAWIPGGFLLITLFNLAVCRLAGGLSWCMGIQVLISLVFPFALQAAMGGATASGMVIFWSFVALTGAPTFKRRFSVILWVVLDVIATVMFTLFDPVINLGDRRELFDPLITQGFLTFNVASVTILIFSIALQFVRVQGRMRKRLMQVKYELQVANVVLEEQRADMLNGMRYARHIQNALLPDLHTARDVLDDIHVMDRSRDAVGGDTYWYGGHGAHSFLVILDCTGHGTPGAMLSMLCHGILNELVYKDHVEQGNELIRRTQLALDQHLHRDRSGSTDGAEMAVIHFDDSRSTVHFSGIGCSMIQADAHRVEVHRGQRSLPTMISGWSGLQSVPLRLTVGTRLYLFTDGILDQFGSGGRTKYSLRRLVEEVANCAPLPFTQATEQVETALSEWRGDHEQVDDMLLIALVPQAKWSRVGQLQANISAA